MMVRIFPVLLLFLSTAPSTAAQSDEIQQPTNESSSGDLFSRPESHGLTPHMAVLNDSIWNSSGGIKRGTVNFGEIDLSAGFDLEKIIGLSGGSAYLSTIMLYGGYGSDYSGDVQGGDNIEAFSTVKIFELWYEQELLEGKLSILAGLQDYNAEFYVADYAATLINPSFGIGPEAAQSGVSIFPTTAPAVRLKIRPDSGTYLQTAIYDGVSGDPQHPSGTQIKFGREDGILWAAEGGVFAPEERGAQKYFKAAAGAWYLDRRFEGPAGERHNGNSGAYIILENTIFCEQDDPGQHLGYFLQLGLAQDRPNQFERYTGFGLAYVGLLPWRNADTISAGVAYARSSDHYNRAFPQLDRSAAVYELTYRAVITDKLALQPDLSWVHNPANDPQLDDSVVFTLRVEAEL